eukprot:9099305-Pyramimonas_sp.AAC.1
MSKCGGRRRRLCCSASFEDIQRPSNIQRSPGYEERGREVHPVHSAPSPKEGEGQGQDREQQEVESAMEITPKVQDTFYNIHVNLGHPSVDNFAKVLTAAQAKPEVLAH